MYVPLLSSAGIKHPDPERLLTKDQQGVAGAKRASGNTTGKVRPIWGFGGAESRDYAVNDVPCEVQ